MQKKIIIGSLLALMLTASFFLYYPATKDYFSTRDDFIWMQRGHEAIDHPELFFTTTVFGSLRPIVRLIFGLEYRIFGLNPYPFHIFNLGVYALVGLLFWMLIYENTKHALSAFLGLSLLLFTPSYTYNVYWLSGIAGGPLFAVFFLLTLFFWKKNKSLSALNGVLAILSGEFGVFLPTFLLIRSWRNKADRTWALLLHIPAIVFFLWLMLVLSPAKRHETLFAPMELFSRLGTAIEYLILQTKHSGWIADLVSGVALGLAGLGVWKQKKLPHFFKEWAVIFFFVLAVFLTNNYSVIAWGDYWMYLPTLFFSFVFAGLIFLASQNRRKIVRLVPYVACLLLFVRVCGLPAKLESVHQSVVKTDRLEEIRQMVSTLQHEVNELGDIPVGSVVYLGNFPQYEILITNGDRYALFRCLGLQDAEVHFIQLGNDGKPVLGENGRIREIHGGIHREEIVNLGPRSGVECTFLYSGLNKISTRCEERKDLIAAQ